GVRGEVCPSGGGPPAAPPPAAERGRIVDVELPQRGDSVAEGTLLEWLGQVGDTVAREQGLAEIATDKVDAELPAPVGGVVEELLVKPDATIPVGTVLLRIREQKGAQPKPKAAEPEPEPEPEAEAAS